MLISNLAPKLSALFADSGLSDFCTVKLSQKQNFKSAQELELPFEGKYVRTERGSSLQNLVPQQACVNPEGSKCPREWGLWPLPCVKYLCTDSNCFCHPDCSIEAPCLHDICIFSALYCRRLAGQPLYWLACRTPVA